MVVVVFGVVWWWWWWWCLMLFFLMLRCCCSRFHAVRFHHAAPRDLFLQCALIHRILCVYVCVCCSHLISKFVAVEADSSVFVCVCVCWWVCKCPVGYWYMLHRNWHKCAAVAAPAAAARLGDRLVSSQLGEGRVHLVGQRLVSVLVDAQLVWSWINQQHISEMTFGGLKTNPKGSKTTAEKNISRIQQTQQNCHHPKSPVSKTSIIKYICVCVQETDNKTYNVIWVYHTGRRGGINYIPVHARTRCVRVCIYINISWKSHAQSQKGVGSGGGFYFREAHAKTTHTHKRSACVRESKKMSLSVSTRATAPRSQLIYIH